MQRQTYGIWRVLGGNSPNLWRYSAGLLAEHEYSVFAISRRYSIFEQTFVDKQLVKTIRKTTNFCSVPAEYHMCGAALIGFINII